MKLFSGIPKAVSQLSSSLRGVASHSSSPDPASSMPSGRSAPPHTNRGAGGSASTRTPTPPSSFEVLRIRLRDATPLVLLKFFSAAEVPRNDSNVPCATANVIEVNFLENGESVLHRIHANTVEIDRLSLKVDRKTSTETPPPVRQCYPAGQSPNMDEAEQFLACEKMLVQGIESGLGVYQFVSPRAHFQPEKSREKPILDTLLKQLKDGKEIILGGRYRVVNIEEPHPPEPGIKEVHKRYLLTVSFGDPTVERRIPLTQVGLQLTKKDKPDTNKAEKFLNAAQILHADTLLGTHHDFANAAPLHEKQTKRSL